jgi:hypothetical protein
MDTAKVLKRQLSYCLRGAETDAQRHQVQWWLDQVATLARDQPPAASTDAAPVGAGDNLEQEHKPAA